MRVHITALLLVLTGNARGDDHDFHTLDRLTPTSSAGLSLGLAVPARTTVDWAFGGELSVHYVHASGAGGYLIVPASYIASDAGANQKALGNAELGGLYSHRITPDLDLIGHVGVAYDYEHQGIAQLQYLAAVPRYGDLVQRWGFTTWLRFGLSAIGHNGRVFWRGDAGVDLMLDDHDGLGAHISPVVRAGFAGGLDLGRSELTLELVGAVADPDDRYLYERLGATIAAGGRIHAGRWNPGVAVVLPLLFDTNPLDRIVVAFAVSVTARFP